MRRNFQRLSVAVLACVSAVSLSACTVGFGAGDKESEAQKVGLTASVKDDATDVSVVDPVTVEVAEGHRLDSVTMTNPDGKEVKGSLDASGTKWTTAEPLGYSKTYELTATSGSQTLDSSFTTVTPDNQTYAAVSPADGATVGVGQPIAVRFDESVPDRQAAQDAIKVTTDPKVEGAFYWLNNHEVRWRPEKYWKPGTKVSVKVDIYGKNLGDDLYGQDENETSFTIGDEVIAVADDSTKTLTVKKNGEVVNSMPISMGSNSRPTPNGQYILGDHNRSMVMDSRTYGLALNQGGYVTPVNYATQMSYSGIYVHGAPWSTWAQGSVNQSHGCINVTDANAKWFLENTKRGDIVIVKNTVGDTLSGIDGLGDWNIPWETWKKGNADETGSW